MHTFARLEDWSLAAAGVFEKPNAVVGLAGTINEQVKIAVTIPIHRHRPRPETNPKIHHKPGMVVFNPLQIRCRKHPNRSNQSPQDVSQEIHGRVIHDQNKYKMRFTGETALYNLVYKL